MTVKLDRAPRFFPINRQPIEAIRQIRGASGFDEALQRIEHFKPLRPSSPEAKKQAEIASNIAHMQLLGLNTSLLSAFSGQGSESTGNSGGMPEPDSSGMASLMQMLQTLQPESEAALSSQNNVAYANPFSGPAAAGPSGERPYQSFDWSGASYNSDDPVPDTVIPARTAEGTDGQNSEANRRRSAGGDHIEAIIERAARLVGLDANLIRAVAKTESNFNPSAVSPAGAMGLMQLMPGTARDLGVDDPFDPEANVMGGATYLKSMLNRYDGDLKMALAAYNWGPGNLDRNRNSGFMPAETRNYIRIVGRHYKGFNTISEPA